TKADEQRGHCNGRPASGKAPCVSGVTGRQPGASGSAARERNSSKSLVAVNRTSLVVSAPSARQCPHQRERDAGARGLEPELDTFLQEEQPDEHQDGGGRQAAPVQLLAFELEPARAGAAARSVDDLVRNLAIAFAVELEILAAAGIGDHGERGAIER